MSSRSGGLLELVSRGKKDVFFTANPVISHVHSVYTRQVPFTKETYITKPRNNPVWGKTVEFPIEHRGDIITDMYLRILWFSNFICVTYTHKHSWTLWESSRRPADGQKPASVTTLQNRRRGNVEENKDSSRTEQCGRSRR